MNFFPPPKSSESVAVAMSGGLDSSVTAALLLENGFGVFGIFMKHRFQREDESDAKIAADFLKIPLKIIDVSDSFQTVIDDFCSVYLDGMTPNPCVFCNRIIKFGVLFDAAISKFGADYFATGHYLRRGEFAGFPALFRAIDETKDQSYVLYGVEKNKLNQLLFPLGEYQKNEIRNIAKKLGLSAAEKKESQDICFVESGKHANFVHKMCPGIDTSGKFVSPDGKILGLHGGYERFTIGQRKGMGVGFGERVFVLDIKPTTKEVVIGEWNLLARTKIIVTDLRWLTPEIPDHFASEVKIRYRTPLVECHVTLYADNAASVEFSEPIFGIAPGQSAVFYEGERLLGGGIISFIR